MEELFRFNITRPVTRLEATTLALTQTEHEGQPEGHPGDRRTNSQRWAEYESTMLSNITGRSDWLLSSEFQQFTADIKNLLGDLLALPPGEAAPENWPSDFRTRFETQANNPDLNQWKNDLSDLFLALLIIRRGGQAHLNALIKDYNVSAGLRTILFDKPSLGELADILHIISLLLTDSSSLENMTVEDVHRTMNQTLLLPPEMLSAFAKPIQPVGFTDLYLVKQHIHHYELGEIARIENILKGEKRTHSRKHFLSNERETSFQTENTTETEQDLTSTDKVSIRNEVENTLKEDTKIEGGVHVNYDGAAYNVQTNLTAAYDRSSTDSQNFASEIAKDVTQKSAKKVSQRVQQSERIKVIETFQEDEEQGLQGDPEAHISGIYQWVEKVYLAQVFNYGRHLLFDIMVPEPAASLMAAATVPLAEQHMPVPPDPLGSVLKDADGIPILDANGNKQLDVPLPPLKLSDDPTDSEYFYGHWIAKFGVTGVEPPPPKSVTVAQPKIFPWEDNDKSGSEILRITSGYGAYKATVSVDALRYWDPIVDAYTNVTIGGKVLPFPMSTTTGVNRTLQDSQWIFLDPDFVPPFNPLNPPKPIQVEAIGVTIYGSQINQLNVNIELECLRMPELMAKWQLDTYEKIFTAWQKLQSDYEEKMAVRQFQKASVGPLGATNPEINRQIERTELKRACIAILDNDNATVRGVDPNVAMESSPDTDSPVLPEPTLERAQELGARVRWFEQAFEWDKIGYIFYPYFWGRRENWITQLNLKNDDPLFQNFLQAGYARVVIPVRIGFEHAMNFYLLTGLPWLGGDLPKIGDETQNPLYLSLVEEMKAQTGAPGDELPVGDPWFIRLPTTLIKLRKDDKRPTWSRVPEDILPPDGPWTWEEGTPDED